MKKFHTVSVRASDVALLGHRPQEVLRAGAEIWASFDDAAKAAARDDSDYYDFCKKGDQRKSDPMEVLNMRLTNEVWKAAREASLEGKVSPGIRCLIRLAARKRALPRVNKPQRQSVEHWQTVTVGAGTLTEIRTMTGRYFDDAEWIPLALQVWKTFDAAKRAQYTATAKEFEWLRKQEKDKVFAISARLARPDWDTIVNLGGGNRSRGARVVLRALLDVMREAKTAPKENPA